jgi:hypothetical protein
MAAIQVFASIGMAVSGLVAAKAAYEAACWARGIVLDARRYRDLRTAREHARRTGTDPRSAVWEAFASR